MLVEIRRSGYAGGELAEAGMLAAPEVPDGVAVLAVPLRPLRREVTDLVAAGSDVPGLGDEFDLADRRILLHEFEERAQPVDVVEPAGQGGGQVEPESVDVHFGHPVSEGVHDQLQRVRVTDVEAVARPGVVHVVPLVVVDQAVVGGVVDTAEPKRGPHVVALGGVVVDDVEDHLDTRLVQGPHHGLELLHLPARRGAGRVLLSGAKKPIVL